MKNKLNSEKFTYFLIALRVKNYHHSLKLYYIMYCRLCFGTQRTFSRSTRYIFTGWV